MNIGPADFETDGDDDDEEHTDPSTGAVVSHEAYDPDGDIPLAVPESGDADLNVIYC